MKGIIRLDLRCRFVKSLFSINGKDTITRILGSVWSTLSAFAIPPFGSANKRTYGLLYLSKFDLCQTSNVCQMLSGTVGMEVV
jgi:hypothetical protein